MNKVIAIILCFSLLLPQSISAFSRLEADYKQQLRMSVNSLKNLDIVRDPEKRWNETDYITRRDMFKMVHVVKGKNIGKARQFFVNVNDEEADEKINAIKEKLSYYKVVEFKDVQYGTYDYYLVYSLLVLNLISGKINEEGYIADLDAYATYEEALTVIGHLFDDIDMHGGMPGTLYLIDLKDKHPYFKFACEIGLINSSSKVDLSSPKIDETMLNQPILAYEFMHLLYRALYIPTIKVSDFYSSINFRYIENFVDMNHTFSEEEPVDIID